MTWPPQRLGRIARLRVSNVDKISRDDEIPVRLCNYVDVYKNESITGELAFMQSTASHSQIANFGLRTGDTVFTKDSETADDIGVPAYVAHPVGNVVCGYHLAIATPDTSKVDTRYLYWAMSSTFIREQWTVLAAGVTRVGLRGDDIAKALVPLPPLDEQRRIADFLDNETARLDQLLEMRRRQEEHLNARYDAAVSTAIDDSSRSHGAVRLKYAGARITVGIVVTPAAWYVDDGGVPAVRGIDVSPGSIRTDDLVRISAEGDRAHPKSRLRAGDVLVVRTGKAGAACAVPDLLVGANAIDLLIIRPGRDLLPRYLEYIINSERTRRFVDEFSVGTIQSHFNVGTLGELPIPVLPLPLQAAVVQSLDVLGLHRTELVAAIGAQRELLAERRRALITAAVTGQLDVTTAGRGA